MTTRPGCGPAGLAARGARGLKIAAAIRADGEFDRFVKDRYSSFDTGIGAEIESGKANFRYLYPDDLPLWDKVRTIAQTLYGAQGIIADKKIRDHFTELQKGGFGHYPICMAKTQYSFSTDPNLKGAPSNHVVPIRELKLSAGAEFLVVICGEIMTMPGLPRVPAANSIFVNKDGQVEGLF